MTQEFNGNARIVRMDWREETPVDNTFLHGLESRAMGGRLARDRRDRLDKNWLDRAGNFLSDTAHVVERLTAASPYHIACGNDRGRKSVLASVENQLPAYRRMERDVQLMEFKCQPFVEELVYRRLRRSPPRS